MDSSVKRRKKDMFIKIPLSTKRKDVDMLNHILFLKALISLENEIKKDIFSFIKTL